jgi:hypothetical protein
LGLDSVVGRVGVVVLIDDEDVDEWGTKMVGNRRGGHFPLSMIDG